MAIGLEPKRLTILHLTAPAAFGGLESVVEALAVGHVRAGHEVHVAGVLGEADPEPRMLAALRGAGVNVHILRLPGRAYRTERRLVARLCAEVRPDVVHTHGFRSDVVDGAVVRRLGIPIVTTVHGFTRNGWRGRLYERLQRRSHRRFDSVVAVSKAQTTELVAAGVPTGRITVLRNAWFDAAPRLSRSDARAALGVLDDSFHVGWVGRLSQEKGPDLFIESVAKLAAAGVPVRASLIGDGPDRNRLMARVQELRLKERIRFCGPLIDAGRYFEAFDAFVMSSRTEGAPIVLFEAMAAGVPVVAAAVGGIPEIVTAAEAQLVEAEDADALAAGIHEVYSAPGAAADRAKAASLRLQADFAVDPWLAAYESIYSRITRKSQHERETVS